MIAARTLALAVAGAFVSLAVVRWQAAGRFVEEPEFTVERSDGSIEVRRYAPLVRAETTVSTDDWNRAVNEGFRRLAGYIFGANQRRSAIAMTAPVTQSSAAGAWLVTFTMPRGSAMDAMPVPNDARVTLRALPSRRVAVLRYSGSTTPAVLAAHERTLRAWLARNGWSSSGAVTSARYDPPSTLPMLRRNELWIELDAR